MLSVPYTVKKLEVDLINPKKVISVWIHPGPGSGPCTSFYKV